MANSISTYTDKLIMKCLLTHDFADIGNRFEDNVITKIKTGAFFNASNLTEVVAPLVTVIGSFAFDGTNLSTLTLTWSEITSIGVGAFRNGGYSAIPQNLTLPKVTAIGKAAFAGTTSVKNTQLRTISLPLWTGSLVTEAIQTASDGIFDNCSALQSVSAPELQAIPETTFRNCAALTEVNFPKVTSIGSNAFSGCSNLTKIDIGGAVTSMSSAFLSGTSKLEALILRGITSIPTLSNNTFSSTRIASGSAYVYVPKSLEESIKLANRWSTYAAQIRAVEDYPDVCGA